VSAEAPSPAAATARRTAAFHRLEGFTQIGEILGRCHCCRRPIIAGLLGYRCGPAELECANCIPTWAEFRAALAAHAAELGRGHLGAAMRAMTAHLEAGGQVADRLPLEILVPFNPAEGAA
jgi:hypothetical protein